MKNVLFFLFLTGTFTAHSDTLQDALSLRLKDAGYLPKLETEKTWAISGYNPIQYFEYRYGRNDEDNKRYYRVPWTNDGGESHTLRIHMKSLTEILDNQASRQLSQELLQTERNEILNQRQFDVYLTVVEQALQERMSKLLAGRESELNRSLDDNGQMLGLSKVNMKDLVRELERLQKVDVDLQGNKAQRKLNEELSDKEAEESATALLENVGALAKKVAEVNWQAEKPQIARKRIEVKLARIDKEIGWAKDRKLIDHIDLQRDTLEREDSVRIGFNVPFLRFDNENRARDKALLLAKESALERDAAELRNKLRRRRSEVFSLAAQVESLKSRLVRTRGIEKRMKSVQDFELRAVMGDFTFDLERDVLVQALRFYTAYLEYLRDQGAFAAFSTQNVLSPTWAEYKP